MGIALVIVGILIIIVGIFISERIYDIDGFLAFLGSFVGGAVLIIGILVIVFNSASIIKGRTYEQKITMYQEENKNIESQVDVVVQKYMAHEDSTFKTAKNESAMTLVALYPELKSDSLVKEQIKIFNKNNEKIKSLKEAQIDVSTAKFWLYFGK